MRIAQVAPLVEPVPPPAYGGTERVVSYLTEALIDLGHDVTLFASADSRTSATLVPCCRQALRLNPAKPDPLVAHVLQMELVARHWDQFDLVHYHADYLHFLTATRTPVPHLTTLHGRLDLPALVDVHRVFPGVPLISISNAQRKPLPDLNWRATIYHGLPPQFRSGRPAQPKHLTFLGRISPEKRADRAIEIAVRSGRPLVIAAKVDPVDQGYFEHEIAPLLEHPLVTYVGEVDDRGKLELLRDSLALLFPIDWPEPFGLVMIEALACGTPVIAFEHGSVPEVIRDGVTGFIVHGVDDAVAAVASLDRIDRSRCQMEFTRRFTASRMAADYVAEYVRLIEESEPVACPAMPEVR